MATPATSMQASSASIRQVPYLAQVALIAAAYFAVARLSLALAIPPGYATAVWPPSGIALAAALLLGNRVWPGVWIGAALANITVESSFLSAVFIASGNTLEALAGGTLIRRHVGDLSHFERGEDVGKFIVLCALSAAIAATGALVPLAFGHSLAWDVVLRNWWTWWQGDATGMIIVTPLILSWSAPNAALWPPQKKRELSGFGLLLLITAAAISTDRTTHFAPFSLTFVALPFILWAAFRFGQREVTTAIAAVCGVAVWYVLERRDLFASVPLNELLLMLLTFISMVVTTGLVLVAVLGERGRSTDALRKKFAELESLASDRALESGAALLQATERRYRAFFENAGIGIAHTDLKGRLVLVNPKFCEITGYSAEELLSKSLHDLVHADYLASSREYDARLADQTLAPHTVERRYVRSRGEAFWASATTSLVRDAQRQPSFFIHALQDVTERRRMEETLRRAVEGYRVIFDNSVAGIFTVNVAGRVLSANPALVRMLGYGSADELTAGITGLRELYAEPGASSRFYELLLTRKVVEGFETRWRCRNGNVICVSLSARLVDDEIGGSISHIGMAEDITERIRLGEALRDREAGLRRAQAMAKLGHVITDADGAFESWPETLPPLIGVDPSQTPRSTRGWLDMLHPDDRERFRSASAEAAVRGARVDVEYRLQRPDGAWMHIRQVIEPLQEESAAAGPARWFSTLQDVTEERKAETRIIRLNRVYAMLSGINALIVRVRDREELFKEACRIAVQAGQFPVAYVAVADPRDQRVKAVAWAGDECGFAQLTRPTAGAKGPGQPCLTLPLRAGGRPRELRKSALVAGPCHRLHPLIARIGDGHICHRKLSRLHRDPAGFLEQLFSIAYANDECVDAAQHGVDAVQPDDPCFRLPFFGHVLQGAEPACRPGCSRFLLQRLDDLPDVHPRAVGPLQPVFDVDAGSLDSCLGACAPKSLSIVGMKHVQPATRTSRRLRRIDADQRRQRFRPALKGALGVGNHVAKLCHGLRAAQARFALAKRLPQSNPLGDVLGHADVADRPSDLVVDQARAEGDADHVSIPAPPAGLEALHDLPSQEQLVKAAACARLGVKLAKAGNSSRQFISRFIAKHAHQRGVRGEHPPRHIHGENSRDGIVEDDAVSLHGASQGFFHPSALGHVLQRMNEEARLALRVAHQRGCRAGPERLAAAADIAPLHSVRGKRLIREPRIVLTA